MILPFLFFGRLMPPVLRRGCPGRARPSWQATYSYRSDPFSFYHRCSHHRSTVLPGSPIPVLPPGGAFTCAITTTTYHYHDFLFYRDVLQISCVLEFRFWRVTTYRLGGLPGCWNRSTVTCWRYLRYLLFYLPLPFLPLPGGLPPPLEYHAACHYRWGFCLPPACRYRGTVITPALPFLPLHWDYLLPFTAAITRLPFTAVPPPFLPCTCRDSLPFCRSACWVLRTQVQCRSAPGCCHRYRYWVFISAVSGSHLQMFCLTSYLPDVSSPLRYLPPPFRPS